MDTNVCSSRNNACKAHTILVAMRFATGILQHSTAVAPMQLEPLCPEAGATPDPTESKNCPCSLREICAARQRKSSCGPSYRILQKAPPAQQAEKYRRPNNPRKAKGQGGHGRHRYDIQTMSQTDWKSSSTNEQIEPTLRSSGLQA